MKEKTRWGTLFFALVLSLSFGLSGCDTGSDVSGPDANVPGGSLILPSGYGWWHSGQYGGYTKIFAANGTMTVYELLFCCNTWDLEAFIFWSVSGNTLRLIEPGFDPLSFTFFHPSQNELVIHAYGTRRYVRRNLATLGGRWDVECRCW